MDGDDALDRLQAEVHALRYTLGKKVAAEAWPPKGATVVIEDTWDGPELYGTETFLYLQAGDHVVVKHRNHEGLLYGTIELEDGEVGQSGWFGGHGCTAALEVILPVRLGPEGGPQLIPTASYDEVSEAEAADGFEAPAEDHGDDQQEEDDEDAGAANENLDEEIEEFLARNGIDDEGREALLQLEPELQKTVIVRDLTNCRYPSKVLLTRIERALNGEAQGPPASGPPPPNHGIILPPRPRSRSPHRQPPPPAPVAPPRVAEAPKKAPINLAAAQAAIKFLNSRSQPAAAAAPQNPLKKAVEEFIMRVGVDAQVAAELRTLTPNEIQEVIENDPQNVRNPSAVVSSRIQTARAHAAPAPPFRVEDFVRREGMPAPPPQPPTVVPATRVVPAKAPVGSITPAMVAAAAALQHQVRAAATDNHLDEYIRRHGLDERCAQDLRTCTAAELKQVVDVDLANARNKSAVVASRIQVVKERERLRTQGGPAGQAPQAGQHAPRTSTSGAVETYLARHPVEPAAAQALRELPPALQAQVMEKDLSNCKNASAVLLSRIRFVNAVSS